MLKAYSHLENGRVAHIERDIDETMKMKMKMLLHVLDDLLHQTHLVLTDKWRKSDEVSEFVHGKGEKMKIWECLCVWEEKGSKHEGERGRRSIGNKTNPKKEIKNKWKGIYGKEKLNIVKSSMNVYRFMMSWTPIKIFSCHKHNMTNLLMEFHEYKFKTNNE